MLNMLAIAVLLAVPASESQVRDQGAVKGHVWTSAAGLESARISLRALSALANDAPAWDARHARELLKEAKDDVAFARTHARHLKMFSRNDSAKDLARLDQHLSAAFTLLDKIGGPIARGVGPGNLDTQADNTMLGGAAAERGLPPGKGGDVPQSANRGQRGGTREVRQLRDDIKAAWDGLDEARKDLDKVASDYDTTAKLPEP